MNFLNRKRCAEQIFAAVNFCVYNTYFSENPDVVRLLVKNGADVNAVNIRNETALSKAIYESKHWRVEGFNKIAEFLLENGANAANDSGEILTWAADKGKNQILDETNSISTPNF